MGDQGGWGSRESKGTSQRVFRGGQWTAEISGGHRLLLTINVQMKPLLGGPGDREGECLQV